MSIAIAKNHMAEMKMLGMLAVLDKTLTEATRDKISYIELGVAPLVRTNFSRG